MIIVSAPIVRRVAGDRLVETEGTDARQLDDRVVREIDAVYLVAI
jgi:hypothetical protein